MRGTFRSPPPPYQNQRNGGNHQHHGPYFFWAPSPTSQPRAYAYQNHYQPRYYRFSAWQRSPPRQDLQDCFYASESSIDCPFHEHGWLGLPGRPIISLVECLLECAANRLNDSGQRGNGPIASEYLHMALKVSKRVTSSLI